MCEKSSQYFIEFQVIFQYFNTFERHQQVHCKFSIGYLPITQISSQPCHQLEWLNLQIRSRHVKRRPSASSLYQQSRSGQKHRIFVRDLSILSFHWLKKFAWRHWTNYFIFSYLNLQLEHWIFSIKKGATRK